MGQKAKNAGKKQSKTCDKLASGFAETVNTHNNRYFKRNFGMTKAEIVEDIRLKMLAQTPDECVHTFHNYMTSLTQMSITPRRTIISQLPKK